MGLGKYTKTKNKLRAGFITVLYVAVFSAPGIAQKSSQLNTADQLLEKALSLINTAEFKQSNTYLTKAARLYASSEKPVKAALCYNHLSSNNRLMSNLDLARKQAKKALSLLQGVHPDDPTEKIRALTNLGLLSAITANYERSLQQLNRAKGLLNAEVSTSLKIVVIGSLGYLYDDLGKYDKALYHYNKALGILKSQSDPSKFRLAKLYNNMGVSYANKGLYERARHYYQLELEMNLSVKGEDHPDIAGTYLNIGNTYYRSGDAGEALLYFKRAYRTILDVYGKRHQMTALTLNNVAKSELKLGNYKQAIAYLNEAIAVKKKIVGAGHPELAISYQAIGKAYAAMENWNRARNYFKKALTIRKQSLRPNHPQLAVSYNLLANFYLENKEDEKALEKLHHAESILLTSFGSNHPLLAKTYASMARAHSQKGDEISSILLFQKALSVVAPAFSGLNAKDNPKPAVVEYPSVAVSVLYHKAKSLCKLHKQTGDLSLLKAALWTYTALSKLLDHQQWGYNQLNSKLALGRRSHKIYEDAIRASYRMYTLTKNTSYFYLIFYFSEKSKARVVLETVAHTNDKQFVNIPDTLLQHEQQLQFKLAQLKQQLYQSFDSQKEQNLSVEQLRDSLFKLNRNLAAFVRRLEQQFPKYHRLKYSSQFPVVYKIMQRLEKQDSAILEYFYGQNSLYAIIITRDKIWVEPLHYSSELQTLATKFTNAIINKSSDYRSAGYRLYKKLIEPVQPYIKSAESLLIVPSGPLRLLPFEALLTQPKNSNKSLRSLPYLVKDYNISYATSVALNVAMSHIKDSEFEKTFVGYAPVFSVENTRVGLNKAQRYRNWDPLPFSSFEVKKIASQFTNESTFWDFLPWIEEKNTVLFLKQEAAESNFKQIGSLNARYIHLATHAFVAGDNRRRSGIVFFQNSDNTNDDILYTNEIYNLQLHTRLVVLSACETAIGTIIRGEGIMGLSRAFQYAGANNMIVSLWKVTDRSTAALMVSFYNLLQQKYSMPEALSEAKRILIKNGRYAHPRFWAAFKLVGNSQQ